jgi:hypothetical protein
MTVTEAWGVLRAQGIQSRDYDLFPAAPYIEALEQAKDDVARKRIQDAMWTLLSDGGNEDQAIAATFFAKTRLPSGWGDRVAAQYITKHLDGHSALAALLSGQPISDHWRDALRTEFRQDPLRHARFASSLIVNATDPADWVALLALADQSNDPNVIADVFNAAFARGRSHELGPVLSKKPAALLRAAATKTYGDDFLSIVGLP